MSRIEMFHGCRWGSHNTRIAYPALAYPGEVRRRCYGWLLSGPVRVSILPVTEKEAIIDALARLPEDSRRWKRSRSIRE